MNCWHTLGLTPTSDQRAIKRAYFTQLKLHRPEDDARAFQQVREAYETALEHSTQPWLWPDEAPEPEQEPDPTVSDVDVETATESNTTPPETVFPRAWTDDDLPAWLRDLGEDELPPADEPATARPPSDVETPAAPDPATTLHDKAEHVVADLLNQWRHADPTQDITALLHLVWRQREWQPPALNWHCSTDWPLPPAWTPPRMTTTWQPGWRPGLARRPCITAGFPARGIGPKSRTWCWARCSSAC